MTEAEALRLARAAAEMDVFVESRHRKERMFERGAKRRDIRAALLSATSASPSDERFVLEGGVDTDGDALTVVVAFEWHTVIVTIF
jgi:hypothetical protein